MKILKKIICKIRGHDLRPINNAGGRTIRTKCKRCGSSWPVFFSLADKVNSAVPEDFRDEFNDIMSKVGKRRGW